MNNLHLQRAEEAQRELEEAFAKIQGGVTEETAPAAATESEPEAKTETVPSSEVVETETQAPATEPESEPQPTMDVDYWMKKGAEKRNKELETGMHKAFEEKKALGKELEETKAQLSEIQRLKAELEELKTKTLAPAPTPAPVADLTLDPDFEENYPDVAAQLKKALSQALPKAAAPVQTVLAELEAMKAKEAESRAKAEAEAHFQTVAAAHPDAGKFFTDENMRGAIEAWAETKAPIYLEILNKPIAYRPQDVSWVLSEFKKEAGMASAPKPKAKPVTGDIAIKTGTPTTPNANAANSEYLTDKELGDYDKLLASALQIRDPQRRMERLQELERKATNTLFRKQA